MQPSPTSSVGGPSAPDQQRRFLCLPRPQLVALGPLCCPNVIWLRRGGSRRAYVLRRGHCRYPAHSRRLHRTHFQGREAERASRPGSSRVVVTYARAYGLKGSRVQGPNDLVPVLELAFRRIHLGRLITEYAVLKELRKVAS
jgi:hypothetical protein